MIKNYIKLAWRVLSRKKFFTFITLFGISFTLMVLMLITSYFQAEFGSKAPMKNQDELVILEYLTLQKVMYDTIAVVDTTFDSGVAVYDTTYDTKRTGRSISTSSFNEKLLQDHFRDLESIKASTIFNTGIRHDVFVNNSKLQIAINHCDAPFWDIFNFQFIEGRPFDASEVTQQAQVAVIAQKLAKSYFGKDKNVLGKFITVDARQYKVIGVVKDPTSSPDPIIVDMFLPYTNAEESYRDPYFGNYSMALLSDGNVEKTKKEAISASHDISLDLQDEYNELILKPVTYKELYAKALYYDEDPAKSLQFISWLLIGLLSLFILLPVLNLINLNVSRIMDRSSEIGVRKAFGATNSQILTQFVFENIVQTLIGGLIGFLLAFIAMYFINQSKSLGAVVLEMNVSFFLYSLLICLFFGILSGLLPALKMSKLQIVNALKTNQL
ncbi:MAG: ABC transporter permease [Saprospiraceae bacterium]|nr:ABC transporter permease [Saprospiraceae bacterium]